MEYGGKQKIKKLCNFYVSELHLSVMLLPYLSRQINEDVEITTIFEKIEKKNIGEILDKLNIKNKEKILKIILTDSNKDANQKHNTAITQQTNKDENEKINNAKKKDIKENKDLIIIIGGNKNYVAENHKNITKLINDFEDTKKFNSAVKIIDCYNADEVGIDMRSIVREHDGLLNTSGEINICDL